MSVLNGSLRALHGSGFPIHKYYRAAHICPTCWRLWRRHRTVGLGYRAKYRATTVQYRAGMSFSTTTHTHTGDRHHDYHHDDRTTGNVGNEHARVQTRRDAAPGGERYSRRDGSWHGSDVIGHMHDDLVPQLARLSAQCNKASCCLRWCWRPCAGGRGDR
jgi:hypothetical protein